MALSLLNQLAQGSLAQAVDTSGFYSAAFNAPSTSACNFSQGSADFAGLAANASFYSLVMTDLQPIALQFAPGSDAESTVRAAGYNNVQTFSKTMFQVLMDPSTASTQFDDAYKSSQNLLEYEVLSMRSKLSASVDGILSGDVVLASDSLAGLSGQTLDAMGSLNPTIIVEIIPGSTVPDFVDVLEYHTNTLSTTVPTCFNITGALGTPTVITDVSGSRVSYQIVGASSSEIAWYQVLLANEPQVLWVEASVAPRIHTRTANDVNGGAALSIVKGDAPVVAQGYGVSGQCQYMHDRDIDGRGEIIGIIDNGLDDKSTFFFGPDNTALPCAASETCCAFGKSNCSDFVVVAGCDIDSCTDISVGNITDASIQTAGVARRIVSYVPLADNVAADHGTQVASAIVGDALSARGYSCSEAMAEGVSAVEGVASGATAVFVDVGVEGQDDFLVIPQANFGELLQAVYDQGANSIITAFGAATEGSSDAVTRDIDAFTVSNSDGIVVAAAGDRTSIYGNGNTALAKNAISVSVFSSAATSTLRPTLSVLFSNPLTAGTAQSSTGTGVNDQDDSCETAEFSGSSAAASIVTGQVALVEEYLKTQSTIYKYDAAGAQTASTSYTGATVRAILVAAAADNGAGFAFGNGFGVPTLDKVLPFESEHQVDLRLEEHSFTASGQTLTRVVTVTDTSVPLVVTIAYTDTATTPFGAGGAGVVNDIRLTVTTAATSTFREGIVLHPNGENDDSGPAENNQKVVVAVPTEGTYTISVNANFLSDAMAADQSVSLVVSGRFSIASSDSPVVTGQDAGAITDIPSCCPWGTVYPTSSCFPITFIVLIVFVCLLVGLIAIICVSATVKVKDVTHH